MPSRKVLERARRDKQEGKAPTTQAGEFIREEFHHIREGKHGARSAQQAIAIGLSKARRSGVELKPPAEGQASQSTREKAERDFERGHGRAPVRRATPRRRAAAASALQREGRASGSKTAIARQSRRAASRRSKAQRGAAAKRAARTKGPSGRSAAATRAVRSRGRRARP